MPRRRKTTALARSRDAGEIPHIPVTARAKALEAEILTYSYTNEHESSIAKRFGLTTAEVMDCIRGATEASHRKAYEKSSHFPDIARARLRAFAPRAADIVMEIANDAEVKSGVRLSAAVTALEASGGVAKAPTSVNIFPVLSTQELKEILGAAVQSGISAAPTTPEEAIIEAETEDPPCP